MLETNKPQISNTQNDSEVVIAMKTRAKAITWKLVISALNTNLVYRIQTVSTQNDNSSEASN